MSTQDRRTARGARHSSDARRRLGSEVRTLRIGAGLSQQELGKAVGTSHTTISRVERGDSSNVTLDRYARILAVLGCRLSVRAYPEGPPLRELGHTRLFTRFRAELHEAIGFAGEVPIGIPGDLRALDARLTAHEGVTGVEAETVLVDVQALDRRIALKMADGGIDRVILLVADTARNRAIVRESASLLDARYPLRTRAALRALRQGRLPARSGIVVL